MFQIKESDISYYDAEARCEHPVTEIANIEGMIFGIVRIDTLGKKPLIVCRWENRFTPKGYPVGRRGPCWMSMPFSMTQHILNGLYIATDKTEEAFYLEEFITNNFKQFIIDLRGSNEARYEKKHGKSNLPSKARN
jgi:hypothetical protein